MSEPSSSDTVSDAAVPTAPPPSGHRFSPAQVYRVVAVAEAITWTLLIAALIVKYGFDPDTALLFPAGLTHGFVFVAYGATAIVVGLNQRWKPGLVALGILTAIVPYATIPFDRALERRGLLKGDWRVHDSGDPRDKRVIDRMLRWFLARPWLLLGLIVAAVVAVVAVLLVLGPPGEWGK
ncbi:DUF3817 domain-containing protein [Ruicaihuangia caeni]|uniref:DUF3817 domain-containing protein n=1 Tax=Ruicaihuangia caeni TaxID=3042517 RepID=A0AAW6T7U6_9MICO|nr:DUF3817 domain-containing protein [Klugiella sp. YN-L-19]MDI2098389.1 DUF3817 domain-containing protein [Klugiella sp. YN-L-19]